MKEQEYTIQMKKGYSEKVMGKPFPVVDWMETFIRFDDKIKRYILSEKTSGAFICLGQTMKGARARAIEIINHVGKDRILELVEVRKLDLQGLV